MLGPVARNEHDERPDRSESEGLRPYIRGMAGGLLIGLPLLFTMEMWWHGFLLPAWKILVLLAIAFGIVVAFNSVSGFRRDRSATELVVDSVEALGLAIVVAFVALLLLGRLDLATDLRDAVRKVALEAIPVSFGFSIASAQLGEADAEGTDRGDQERGSSHHGSATTLLLAAGGALVFALNVAPTEEPVMLGIEAPWWQLAVVMAATYIVTLAIVFHAEFAARRPGTSESPLESPLGETLAAYAVSLGVALLLLWAFGRTEGVALPAIAGQTVMLGVVASLGAAVGRLLLEGQGGNDDHADQGAEA